MVAPRAQFHRAAKHKQIARHGISTSITTGLLTKCPRDFRDEQTIQLNTSNKQYSTNGNLVGNPVFIKEEISG